MHWGVAADGYVWAEGGERAIAPHAVRCRLPLSICRNAYIFLPCHYNNINSERNTIYIEA